ncbi:MAG: Fe-S cluster assembly sulfur transfer protein SufU, partial [Nanoarchaeota archaeon]
MKENLDPNWIGNSEEDEIYKENILDHFKNPRNFKPLKDYDIYHKEFNPVCGDQIELFVKLNGTKVIDVGFIGKGCAISMASASMLTEKLKDLSLNQIKNIKKEEVLEMIGIPLGI